MWNELIEWLYMKHFDPRCCLDTISVRHNGAFTGGLKTLHPLYSWNSDYLSVQGYIDCVKHDD